VPDETARRAVWTYKNPRHAEWPAAQFIVGNPIPRELEDARADGSLRSLLVRFSRIDVLVIYEWAMAPLAESERRDFW